MTYKFEIEELKARDIPGISKAIDIALSRLLYPNDMAGWQPGQPKVLIVRTTKSETDETKTEEELAGDLVALRYLHFLFKKKVAEVTGIEATSNDDVDWEYHHLKPERTEERLVRRIES